VEGDRYIGRGVDNALRRWGDQRKKQDQVGSGGGASDKKEMFVIPLLVKTGNWFNKERTPKKKVITRRRQRDEQ